MFNISENQVKHENWDEESQKDGDKHSDASGAESDDNLRSPLLSRQGTGTGMGIGGGWQLAYRKDENKEGALKRIYLHQEAGAGSRRGSIISLPGCDAYAEGETIHAAALVSQSVLRTESILAQQSIEEAVEKQSGPITKGPGWGALFEPGVKHALIVGVGIQILQQFSGINGILYYNSQILNKQE
ncbi:transporter [Datura stramonium]|uniref:Transporter n=1 Tax=Datura stramonium TaxID=4076 RepID=A0ABS8RPE2_DATST|nr:transporter [Datura stramonium]